MVRAPDLQLYFFPNRSVCFTRTCFPCGLLGLLRLESHRGVGVYLLYLLYGVYVSKSQGEIKGWSFQ